MDCKGQATQQRIYEDFKPIANWVTEERKVLEVHLYEFTKEQLKVQVGNHGILRISGERHIEGNRWCRFSLKFNIPKHCNLNEMQAKFNNGIMHVILPKKPTRIAFQEDHQQPLQAQENLHANDPNDKRVDNAKTKYEVELGGYVVKLNKPTKLVVTIAVTVTVVVALGIYAVYRLK